MTRTRTIVLGLGILFIGILIVAYVYSGRKPVEVTDRLCEFVRDNLKMKCVTVVTTDTYMKPGAIVAFSPAPGDAGRVEPPVSDLFGSACQVQGLTDASLKGGITPPQPASIPQFTYEINKRLAAGAEVELPKLDGVKIEAGPNWSSLLKVELATDDAWMSNLDEFVAAEAITSCQIKESCVQRILAQQYHVVGTTIVTKGLSYRMFSKDGNIISLKAATSANEFKVNLGGRTDIETSADATLKSAQPRVVGVRLMPVNVFTGKQLCQEAIFYKSDGSSVATVSGGGGSGNIGAPRTVKRPLGETVTLNARGSEASECDDAFERTTSWAQSEGKVEALSPASLRFSYDLAAHGGHYATAAQCIGSQLIGKTGHDTSAIAAIELNGRILVTIRTEPSPQLRVDYQDLPPGSELRVLDWRSEPLREVKTDTLANGLTQVSGSGQQAFKTHGAGIYFIEAVLRLNGAVTGDQGDTQVKQANIAVSVVD